MGHLITIAYWYVRTYTRQRDEITKRAFEIQMRSLAVKRYSIYVANQKSIISDIACNAISQPGKLDGQNALLDKFEAECGKLKRLRNSLSFVGYLQLFERPKAKTLIFIM